MAQIYPKLNKTDDVLILSYKYKHYSEEFIQWPMAGNHDGNDLMLKTETQDLKSFC